MGCRAKCAGPQTTSEIPQFSPRDHGKPLQDGAQGWQDKIFTERDQKHWKRPEQKWGGQLGDHCKSPDKR